jgi:hypothetical protein
MACSDLVIVIFIFIQLLEFFLRLIFYYSVLRAAILDLGFAFLSLLPQLQNTLCAAGNSILKLILAVQLSPTWAAFHDIALIQICVFGTDRCPSAYAEVHNIV